MKRHVLLVAVLAIGMGLVSTVPALARGRHHGEDHQRRGEKWFEKMDTNKDGFLTLEEHEAHNDDRFQKIDADQDGYITEEEFTNHLLERNRKRIQKNAVRHFSRTDKNNDKKVSQEEFDYQKQTRFRDADKNNDGKLTVDELKEYHKTRWEEKRRKRSMDNDD